jgi:hypothetical protein
VLLNSLPFPDSERLAALTETSKKTSVMAVAYPDYVDWHAGQNVFVDMVARMPAGGVLTGDGEAERVTGQMVTASFFRTLGVEPQIGRVFTEDEDRLGADPVIVLSYGLWQRRYGGDRRVIGRAIQFNSASWTVVGMMPARFDFYGRTISTINFSSRSVVSAIGSLWGIANRTRSSSRDAFGLAPALQTSTADVNSALKEGGLRSTEGGRRLREYVQRVPVFLGPPAVIISRSLKVTADIALP